MHLDMLQICNKDFMKSVSLVKEKTAGYIIGTEIKLVRYK